uniref:Uncharacterized protein n=1 Tax=Arundo donax TaxID=35708 RepID=A0A0A8XQJ2_ARUDO
MSRSQAISHAARGRKRRKAPDEPPSRPDRHFVVAQTEGRRAGFFVCLRWDQ